MSLSFTWGNDTAQHDRSGFVGTPVDAVSGGGEQTAEHRIIIADTKTITFDPDLRFVWSPGLIGGATVSGDPDLYVPANTLAEPPVAGKRRQC